MEVLWELFDELVVGLVSRLLWTENIPLDIVGRSPDHRRNTARFLPSSVMPLAVKK